MGWTDDRVEHLKALWADGLSASQISGILGEVTRNAVIGKIHRLGLSGRAGPARPERPRGDSQKLATARAGAKGRQVSAEEPIVLDDGSFATVLTINDRMCHWPIGDPADTTFHFCGHKPKPGMPYCEAHARKAYQPQQLLRRDRRAAG